MKRVWWFKWDIRFKSDFGSLIASSGLSCFWDWAGGIFGSVFDFSIYAVIFLSRIIPEIGAFSSFFSYSGLSSASTFYSSFFSYVSGSTLISGSSAGSSGNTSYVSILGYYS